MQLLDFFECNLVSGCGDCYCVDYALMPGPDCSYTIDESTILTFAQASKLATYVGETGNKAQCITKCCNDSEGLYWVYGKSHGSCRAHMT